MTEKVYEELDDAKAEIEKLKADYCVKVDLCDNLKRSYNDQLKRIEELNLTLEKQAQEVEAKAVEVYAAKQSVEDLQCKLKEKEDIIKIFTSASDRLRVDLNSKLQECEEEKSKLVSSLEEANAKISDLEHKNRAFMEKIEVLREGIVSVSQKKCANESKIAKASQRMRETGDMYENLEEEKVKLEEQFKWKNEQFKHLEEAHEKLKHTLRAKEKEWDMEKCTFFDNISALETKLDSQLKLSEVLRRRLEMCSQALGREENRSKDLDVQLAESNLCIEETKSQLEEMTIKRDEDVGNLEKLLAEEECAFQELECKRGKLEEENRELVLSVEKNKDLANKREEDIGNLEKSLAAKECIIQEMECKIGKLEEDNRELVLSVKKNKYLADKREEDIGNLEKSLAENECLIQELECKIGKLEEENRELVLSLEEIKECNSSSIAKLQDKLTTLEQIHEECSHHSKVREAEWSSRMEKMVADLNSCTLESESKEARLKDITTELDDLNSLVLQLIMEKEESDIMAVAMKSTLLEARLKFDCAFKEMECEIVKLEEDNHELVLSLRKHEESQASNSSSIETLQNRLKTFECEIVKLEEENGELVSSLKQHEESQGSFSSSIETLQNKLKTLEQIHNECSDHSKAREAEWNLRFEKVVADLNSCTLELGSKEAHLEKITKELDDYNSLVLQLTMEKQVSEIMVAAMKSTLLEAKSKIDEENCDLVKVPAEIESVKTVEEKLVQTRSELMNVCDLLEKANEDMAESYCEVNEFEFELQLWKSVAEKLKVDLELNHRMRKEVEDSLLSQVATEVNLKEDLAEKERRVNDLEKQLEELKGKTRLKLANDNGAELEKWEQEWVTKELEAAILAQLESEKIHEHEKQSLNQLVEEKDQRISNLQNIMSSLEEEFDHSSASFSSQLANMQAEMKLFHDAWEKIRTVVVLKEIEVQEKNLLIKELENDLEKQTAFEKECLFSVEKLSSENENLVEIIRGVSDRIKKLSREDGQMMGTLRSIMSGFDENCGHVELKERFDPLKENSHSYQSPKRNMVETSPDARSPLRALNN
nr:hypothetical protein [Tanacetum cinerariifolium]